VRQQNLTESPFFEAPADRAADRLDDDRVEPR
jgi:hypothetical protein